MPSDNAARVETSRIYAAGSDGRDAHHGIAVIGLLTNLHVSLSNTGKLTEYDRAALFAQHKMDDLLTAPALPMFQVVSGGFDPGGGWRALARPFEFAEKPVAGQLILERIELEVWWFAGDRRRNFTLEGFRPVTLTKNDETQIELGGPQ